MKNEKFPILLTIDLDGATGMESIHPKEHIFWTAQGEYGPRVGVHRILELLKKENVKATFCIVGKVAEQYPELIKKINGQGHEIAIHGYHHKPYVDMTEEEEREDIIKTAQLLESLTGKKPVGNRTPLWNPSPRTIKILEEHGFKWNSDFLNDDIPYFHPESTILEIPPSAALNDWAQLTQFRLAPKDMKKVWFDEFDTLYKEGKSFVLTLHPFDMGRPSRLIVLRELIEYIKKHENAEFMRCIDLVKQHQ
ncbi:MAG: polysaccharide deacetylase family protein [Nanoarchaeota archaeon]|nr:polysaccharide deacetylase family protein [Nanoarchaeota archaeon]